MFKKLATLSSRLLILPLAAASMVTQAYVTDAPFATSVPTVYAQDIPYDSYDRTKFDIFVPNYDTSDSTKSPLVIFIHGGGFVSGNKDDGYDLEFFQQDIINALLEENIAFASINYRLLQKNSNGELADDEGILKPMNDSVRALQFMRHNADILDIDTNKIALMGVSAGAGTSLWINFNDDFAKPNASDPVERESTKVTAVVAYDTQATYELLTWLDIFSLSAGELVDKLTEEYINAAYGMDELSEFFSPEIEAYREQVDFIEMIDPNDAPVYVFNPGTNDYHSNGSIDDILHHSLHAETLRVKAYQEGHESYFNIPQLNVSETNYDSFMDFVIQKLSQN